jgi:hypothetical protein
MLEEKKFLHNVLLTSILIFQCISNFLSSKKIQFNTFFQHIQSLKTYFKG